MPPGTPTFPCPGVRTSDWSSSAELTPSKRSKNRRPARTGEVLRFDKAGSFTVSIGCMGLYLFRSRRSGPSHRQRARHSLSYMMDGQQMRARFCGIVNDLLKQSGSASETRWLVTHIMRRKNQPPSRPGIAVDYLLDCVKIVAALLDKERL